QALSSPPPLHDALPICIADDLERPHRIAVLEAHPVLLAVAPDRQLEPFGERVDHRDADAMEAARDLVGVVLAGVLEFPAGVELGDRKSTRLNSSHVKSS